MKTISLNKPNFQSFLKALNFIFHLFYGKFPQRKTEAFTYPKVTGEIQLLAEAVARFELKKCGGMR